MHPSRDVGATLSCEETNLGRQVGQQGTQERPCPAPQRGTSEAGRAVTALFPFHLKEEVPRGCLLTSV